jgi:hypothetical protein
VERRASNAWRKPDIRIIFVARKKPCFDAAIKKRAEAYPA